MPLGRSRVHLSNGGHGGRPIRSWGIMPDLEEAIRFHFSFLALAAVSILDVLATNECVRDDGGTSDTEVGT